MKLSRGKDNIPTFMAMLVNDTISYLVFCIKEKLGHSCLKVLSKPHKPVRITKDSHKTMDFHKLNKELKMQ